MIQIIKSSGELVQSIPINGGWTVLYRVGPMPVRAGQVVNVNVQCEVTLPYQFNVGIGRCLYSVLGGYLSRPCMDNVTPAGHHMVITHHGVEEIPADYQTQEWLFYIWAAAGSPGTITVERDYGGMTAQVYTPDAGGAEAPPPCDCGARWTKLATNLREAVEGV